MRLENAITELQSGRTGTCATRNPVCMLLVTLLYLVAMLSVPQPALGMLILFALYPVTAAPMTGQTYGTILRKSCAILPFVVVLGIFNPIFDTTPAFRVAGVTVTTGWVGFASIVIRGLLSVQALLILIGATGFISVCRALSAIGVPSFITTQMTMVYRYLTVLLEEALAMRRARESRGYGRKRMPLKMWGPFIGQLFLRTVNRADSIHRAMLARGFSGTIPFYGKRQKWQTGDTITLAAWAVAFAVLRFADITSLII